MKASEKKKDSLILFVTSMKQVDSVYVLSGITGKGRAVVNSPRKFKPGQLILAAGEVKQADGIKEMEAVEAMAIEDPKAMNDINKYVDSNIKVSKTQPFLPTPVIKNMSEDFDEVARLVLKAIFLHRLVIIRHHNDTDGVCAGLAMYLAAGSAKNIKIITNKYPGYRMVDAQQDIHLAHQLDAEYLKPLLIVFDIGSSIESFGTYDYVKKAGFDVVVVDHHPPSPGMKKRVDLVVSPHFSGGGSEYTAGLLASEISQRIAKVNLHDIPFVALVGDRSSLEFERKDIYLRYAIALDYLVSMKDPPIDEIARNFMDREAMETNYMLAMERIDVVRNALLKKVKRKDLKNVTVFLIDTDKEFEQGHFPSRGSMANIVGDVLAFASKRPAIMIGHGKHNINTRFNRPALEEGWSGAELINRIREELPNALESGGGHPGAASMRINKGFARIVLDQIMKEIEKESEKKK